MQLTVDAHAACAPNGLYGQLCVADTECIFSTIFFKAEFQCYSKYGVCEEQGKACAWRESIDLTQCIQDLQARAAATDLFSD